MKYWSVFPINLNNVLAFILFMDEKEIQKKIKEGYILAQVSFEVLGSPKEHVESTIKGFIDNIRQDAAFIFVSEEYGEAEETSGELWSTYCDTEMLVKNLDKFNWLCVNFMPASIEIIAPSELRFKDKDLTNWFNDMLSKLHEVSTGYRKLSSQEEFFIKNMNAMVQNAVLLAAENYHTLEEIGIKVGMGVEQLQPFVEAYVNSGKLEKKDEEYYRKK
jgi:hypothetical protein